MSARDLVMAAAGVSTAAAPGQVAYTTPGTYNWVCPAGVTSVSVVCIGGGGGASITNTGGAGLGYKNNISVVPGNSYTVVVGRGGKRLSDPQDSSFSTVCYGKAPTPVTGAQTTGGTYIGDGGGNGGNAGITSGSDQFGGCGGAGGYSGNGGNGGGFGVAGTSGSGGGGGGGGGMISNAAYTGSGAGGGTGIYGQGSNGAGGAPGTSSADPGKGGGGGSSGTAGGNGSVTFKTLGGSYGGGGHADATTGGGGGGAVRIIWPGNLRQFPSTRTANE